jgi:hypothetical protein
MVVREEHLEHEEGGAEYEAAVARRVGSGGRTPRERLWQLEVYGQLCVDHLLGIDMDIAESVAAEMRRAEPWFVEMKRIVEETVAEGRPADEATVDHIIAEVLQAGTALAVAAACVEVCDGNSSGKSKKGKKKKKTKKKKGQSKSGKGQTRGKNDDEDAGPPHSKLEAWSVATAMDRSMGLPAHSRAAAMLARMTREEKIGLMGGCDDKGQPDCLRPERVSTHASRCCL